MRVEWLLQHGWGFDSQVWAQWQSALARDTVNQHEILLGERGYFGKTKSSPRFGQSKETFRIVVAHSLGAHLVTSTNLEKADLVVFICAFAEFHGQGQRERRLSQKVIGRMKEKLRQAPDVVLRDFHEICYKPSAPQLLETHQASLDLGQLAADLQILDEHSFAADFDFDKVAQSDQQLVSIDAELDAVLTAGRQRITHRNMTSLLIPGAGHAAPITHADYCLLSITNHVKHKNIWTDTIEQVLAPLRLASPQNYVQLN